MIPATHHRLLTRGDLPDSMGGLYNPGAWAAADGKIQLVVRHEEDYTWTRPCHATFVTYSPLSAGGHTAAFKSGPRTIPFLGFDAGTRFEDLRPFVWRDSVLITHVAYQPGTGRPVRQRLSRLRADWSAIERWDDWNSVPHKYDIEKNWALGSSGEDLWFVYSLSPLVVFRRHHDQMWKHAVGEDNSWRKGLGHDPRCSTHLLPWRDGYLGWWHIRLDGVYCQGAYWLDRDLRLRRRSGILLDGQDIQYRRRYQPCELIDADEPIYKPGVLYVSSWVDRGDDLWLFAGVGDAHSDVVVVKADDVDRRLR